MKNYLLLRACALLLSLSSVISGSVPSPYQVSVRLYDNYNQNDNSNVDSLILCSGAIVHPYFILLSAHCCYSHSIAHQISRLLMPNMIYIAASDFTGNVTTAQVDSIFVHPSYDERKMDNDIALLKLVKPMNLSTSAIQWIELCNNTTKLQNCYSSFNNVTTVKPSYPYRNPEPNAILDTSYCSNKTNSTAPTRANDLCASYVFSDTFMCKVSKNQLLLSNDRGTPLICSNCLEGVLSEILPASNRTSNSTCPDSLKTTAYYTKVSSHVNWVHSVIGVNLPAGVNGQTEPVKPITPPYQGPAVTPSGPGKPSRGAAANVYHSSTLMTISFVGAITCLFFAHHYSI